jgi:hypothetical protein
MSISYRYLSLESAVGVLDSVRRGEVNVSAELEKDDFHLRPFTDSGIKTERLLEARSLFFTELKAPSESTSDLKISFSEFDQIFTRSCATIFHDMSPIDGFSREVWSYLTLRLLPDLALWRWSVNKTDERFLGGAERSCFQRLWLRSYVLGGDLASQLFEDEAVNIFERPEALGGNKRLALSIANFIVSNRGVSDTDSGEKIVTTEIVKQTAKRLRRAMSVQVVQTMSDSELEIYIAGTFAETLRIKIESKV